MFLQAAEAGVGRRCWYLAMAAEAGVTARSSLLLQCQLTVLSHQIYILGWLLVTAYQLLLVGGFAISSDGYFFYGCDIRYIPKSISLSISVRSTDKLKFSTKTYLTLQSESPCFVVIQCCEGHPINSKCIH